MMKREVLIKQDKNSHRKDMSIKINRTIKHNIINSIEEHIKKWMNMIGTLSENRCQGCFLECYSLVLL